MATKSNIKTCRYKDCKHESKQIDIGIEPYKVVGYYYYHEDCYEEKTKKEEEERKIKADMQLFKNMWFDHINKTVVYSELFSMLNNYVYKRNVGMDYLLFVLQYVIDHKMTLNYPGGFRYYVDRPEIKTAWDKKKKAEQPQVDLYSFKATRDENDPPKFKPYGKPTGFERILGR